MFPPFLTEPLASGSRTEVIAEKRRILVNYAVSAKERPENTRFMLSNLRFFLNYAAVPCTSSDVTYRVTLSRHTGKAKNDKTKAEEAIDEHNTHADIDEWGGRVHVHHRPDRGFDYGAHRDALEAEAQRLRLKSATELNYDVYVFLNDGTRGPFYPAYMPENWHWTDAFVKALRGPVVLVGTSLVCIPKTDPGVLLYPDLYGPKVEGFAFAMTGPALRHELLFGTSFISHRTKKDAIWKGEYNLSANVLRSPQQWSIGSLLLAYQNMDFRDKSNWNCNVNKHPSRDKTYGMKWRKWKGKIRPVPGISISPLEVLFHKAWWRTSRSAVTRKREVMKLDQDLYTVWRDQGEFRAKG